MSCGHKLFSDNATYIESEAHVRAIRIASKSSLESWIKKDKNNISLLQNAYKDLLNPNSDSFLHLPQFVKNTISNPRACFPSLNAVITDERIKNAMQELIESILDEHIELIEQLESDKKAPSGATESASSKRYFTLPIEASKLSAYFEHLSEQDFQSFSNALNEAKEHRAASAISSLVSVSHSRANQWSNYSSPSYLPQSQQDAIDSVTQNNPSAAPAISQPANTASSVSSSSSSDEAPEDAELDSDANPSKLRKLN